MNKEKKMVGIYTGSFHTDYSRFLARTLYSALIDKGNFSVCLMQGLDASRFINFVDYVDNGFDSHYYTQFEYSKFLKPDYLVVSYGTISAIPNPLSVDELLDRLPDVPIIMIESDADRPNCVSVTTDNHTGVKDCVEHLIEEHGCRKIVFVSGPKGVPDAEERLSAYIDTMHMHGLDVTEDMIAWGDFTDHVDPQIERLLESHPNLDAIVCANDEMAESAYRVLRLHGLEPGQDVAVTGFDDTAAAAYMMPPLTSVRQDINDMVREAVRLITQFEAGEAPRSVLLPASLQVRQSCGCAYNGQRSDQNRTRLVEGRTKIKQLTNRNILTALMLRKLLKEDVSREEFFQQLGQLLYSLGIDYSEIFLLPVPAITDRESRIHIPDQVHLQMRQSGKDVVVYSESQPHVINAGEPIEYQGEDPLTVFPLFFGQIHYGAIVTSLKKDDILFCYALSLEIGTGLRYLFLSLEQQENRISLMEKNQILDYSASHDSLTGLYNRPGVLSKIYTLVHAQKGESSFVAVMADLDHLKQINDTFGHDMGDVAIKAAADLLQGSLPDDSLLGRTGGDEFTGVFLMKTEQDIDLFKERLAQRSRTYDANSNLPFYVGVSVGCFTFSHKQAGTLVDMFKEADKLLYEAKKSRRQTVIRSEET